MHDLSTGYGIAFTVLYVEESSVRREEGEGKVLRVGKSEMEISTRFSLEPNQMLYWADRHRKDSVHFATVKWCRKADADHRVGLSIFKNPFRLA